MQSINVDVLVCGGGMSGMACASFAAQSGARVLVVEKQSTVGGSSNYSAGMFWGPQTYEKLRSWVPDGDPRLQRAWLDDYLRAVQWMRENQVPTAPRFDGIMTIGIGFPIKVPHLHSLHRRRIQSSNTGSEIWTNSAVVKLMQKAPGVPGSRITGAIVRRGAASYPQEPATYCQVTARMVVLATGGFQGSSSLTSQYLGQGADNIFVRSNKGSVGDGLNLAVAVGAATSRGMNTYYGHLMAAPLSADQVDPKDYLPLAQYQSKYCLLLNEAGRRFADETTGDEIINQYLAKQEKRRGFLIFNEKTRQQHCVSSLFPNAGDIDRLQKAREHGCNAGTASTLGELVDVLAGWGADRAGAMRTIDEYDRVVRQGEPGLALDAPVGRGGAPPGPLVEGEGPFYAMEVQPSITFTYGGIKIDREGYALTADDTRIPGLLVAGVDAGGFSNLGYAGGLALAFVTGFWAAKKAARELDLPLPALPPANPGDAEAFPVKGRL
ncbi:FAD binding domain-containing protein [Aspergillus pseudodeflectus]|uniref:FAD binding domain-containing protein n=1 Tax=Aspergillus pseudodeflectus TaxID=176178 RepID=A0ABR4KHG0_9EURO